ncbi:MAG: hypothetical protein AAFZ65_08955 [Planctomycetota bacterium]
MRLARWAFFPNSTSTAARSSFVHRIPDHPQRVLLPTFRSPWVPVARSLFQLR